MWIGAKQELDQCLFIGDTVIALMHVDIILMWSTDDNHMVDIAHLSNEGGVDLEEENDAAGFLEMRMTKTSGYMMVMTQEHCHDC